MTDRQDVWAPAVREVLSVVSEVIVLVDSDHRVRHVNRAHSSVFRDAATEGADLQDLLDEEAAMVIKSLIDNAHVTGAATAEHRAGGSLYRVTARRMSSLPDTLLVFQDITGIRDAGESLVNLIRFRSEFLSSLSNELRTPLTAVIGYADMLSDPDPDLDLAAREKMVRDMTDHAWKLAGTVEDLLTVARAELGDLGVASVRVNVAANVAQVLESMGARGGRVTVVGNADAIGIGDPAKFRQIIRNLLSNAFTHGAEPIWVEFAATDGHAIARVVDAGPGLSEELAKSAFEQHTTGGGAHSPRGMGIGLWICRELTGLMGGYLDYRREGNETVFEAAIPLL